MTKRFDRTDSFERIHTQTLSAIGHFDPDRPGKTSYEDAFQVMRRLRLPHTEAVHLFRRMIFNVIARNQNDHTNNIAFLMDDTGRWSLAPAYDIVYTRSPEGSRAAGHQMSINGKTDGFTLDDLLAVAQHISLKRGRELIEDITDTISHWKLYAEEAGIPEQQAESIEKTFRLGLL